MRGKGNQNLEEEDYEDEEIGSRKDGPSSSVTVNNNDSNTNKDGKNIDKASMIRSKHSVTEQRRRSKINERFQILRDLIPHSDQKRDTASFLLEVIEYVQFLQEKVQKYEGSYQGWSPEPTKLLPWRNSHWRVQSFAGHPQAIKNGSAPGPRFPGNFDEDNIAINPTMVTSTQNPVEFDHSRDVACKSLEQQPELSNKGVALSMPLQTNIPSSGRNNDLVAHPLQQLVSDAHSAECPGTSDTLYQQDELTIEAGTISISSAYSDRLLNTLTQALQTAGIDLSQANISMQIYIGNRANRGLTSRLSAAKDPQNSHTSSQAVTHLGEVSAGEESNQAVKRRKT